MVEPRRVHSLNEIHYFLLVTICPDCGKGPWSDISREETSQLVTLRASCQHCGNVQTFSFSLDPPAAALDPAAINPSDRPSEVVDLCQWLMLFQLRLEEATREKSRAASRRYGYEAALCLAEALKFYRDDELPPPAAFFIDTTRNIFREHPEKFARQRLRDMQARLPALHTMAQRIARDGRTASRHWWQFWKK